MSVGIEYKLGILDVSTYASGPPEPATLAVCSCAEEALNTPADDRAWWSPNTNTRTATLSTTYPATKEIIAVFFIYTHKYNTETHAEKTYCVLLSIMAHVVRYTRAK